MENNLLVTSSPHIRGKDSTQRIMIDVIIALLPAVAAGTWFFGVRSLAVILVTVLSCVVSEYLARKVMKRNNTIFDFSAVVTGLLLALNLPSTIPLWIAAVGGVFAIVVVKQLFGGIGQNFVNPALAARVVLLLSWTNHMTNWALPAGVDAVSSATTTGVDAVSSATPLALIEMGVEAVEGSLPSYFDMFIGRIGGTIGETSKLALLIGACYLIFRKVISPVIPVSFIATVGLFTWIFGGNGLFTGDFVYHILAGGLILGAFFMATDYTTSPVTKKG